MRLHEGTMRKLLWIFNWPELLRKNSVRDTAAASALNLEFIKRVVWVAVKSLLRLYSFPSLTLNLAWRCLFGETRTRILLLYALTLIGVVAIAIPIFRALLFANIEARVRDDLEEEIEGFQTEYARWSATEPQTVASLQAFIQDFIRAEVPEDDNFHIFVLDGEFYRANPNPLPQPIRPETARMEEWKALSEPLEDTIQVSNPNIGNILMKTVPLELNGQRQGMFIATHITAGERAEALTSVYMFIQVAIGVVVVAFLLAWLASRQLLKPVQDLADTARSISEADLSRRIEVQGSGELAELADAFNAMMNRVQGAFNSQRNFINDAGHELRTPLTIIQGHLELMGDSPHEREETLALVMDELGRIGRFVNDLILLAKSERLDFLQPETIEIQPLTTEIFNKATALADRHWQLCHRASGTFVGDRQRITEALINLAQNATQHTQPQDTIEIGSRISHHKVRFWVRDTGEGITIADQQRIFERFARATNSYRRSEGAGLGLAIVKAIAEAHGGRVELVSQVGIGSTFTVVLPLDLPQEGHGL